MSRNTLNICSLLLFVFSFFVFLYNILLIYDLSTVYPQPPVLQEVRVEQETTSRSNDFIHETEYIGQFEVTAYTLAYQCCGKYPDNPSYGITASGYDLDDKSRKEAMTIAADQSILPMGTKVLLMFDNTYKDWNGVYVVRDSGSAVHNNIIDIFVGDVEINIAKQFGRRTCKAYLLKEGEE